MVSINQGRFGSRPRPPETISNAEIAETAERLGVSDRLCVLLLRRWSAGQARRVGQGRRRRFQTPRSLRSPRNLPGRILGALRARRFRSSPVATVALPFARPGLRRPAPIGRQRTAHVIALGKPASRIAPYIALVRAG